jgi:hypothetical protein
MPILKRTNGKHFNLLRYFVITSLVTIVVISFSVTYLLMNVTKNKMLDEKKELTTQMAKKFNDELKKDFLVPAIESGKQIDMKEGEFRERLDSFIQDHMDAYHFRQINLIQSDRLILYSTRKELEGIQGKESEAFTQAVNGGIGYKLMYFPEDQAETSLEIFVPFEMNGQIIGVTMVYQNIKDVIKLIQKVQQQIIITMTVGMIVLFLVLFEITRRGHKIIQNQEQE